MNELAISARQSLGDVQSRFLRIQPRLERHARICARHIRCLDKRTDFVSEVVALCWKWWRRLCERGKDPSHFVSALATFAARAVRSGRRLDGQEAPKDVLSRVAQQRHGFAVSRLPDVSTLEANPYSEALCDNRKTPVDEQVQFRLDWPAWLATVTHRNRRLINDMAMGEPTEHLATRYGVSPGRISQLRRQFSEGWRQFCEEC